MSNQQRMSDDENNKLDEIGNGNLSVAEEAELHEFCETSSWETNSTSNEDEHTVSGNNNFRSLASPR